MSLRLLVTLTIGALALALGPAVSGAATWRRFGNRMVVDLTVVGHRHRGRLHGHWATRREGALATLRGSLAGHRVTVTFRAP